ncbi:ankyrin repeat domain-containing protein [Sphingobacterium lactis]|uniref:ankyrin repeat domain-containing protein n=1 Tax=Sphingobacterium lactis TaxID=797291 RepID=UPI003EC81CD8
MDSEVENAVKRGDTVYLDKHVNASNIEAVNAQSQSMLMMATYQDNYDLASFLVKKGADPNQQDEQLNSPFLYAGASGYLDMVKLYLAYGARFDVFNRYHGTALIPAAEKGHIEVVRLLAKTKNFPINHVNRLGWTALMEAIVLGNGGKDHVEIVSILLKEGADPNIPDKDGVLPIEHAKQKGFSEIVEILQLH